MELYGIGYDYARRLRTYAASNDELAVIARLEEFQGSEDDMRVAAGLHLRRGDRHQAAELLRQLPPLAGG